MTSQDTVEVWPDDWDPSLICGEDVKKIHVPVDQLIGSFKQELDTELHKIYSDGLRNNYPLANTLSKIFDYAESDPSQKIYTFLCDYNFRFEDEKINEFRRTHAKYAFRRSFALVLDCKTSPAIKNDPQALKHLKTLLDQPFMRRKDFRYPVYGALFSVHRDMRCPITEQDYIYYMKYGCRIHTSLIYIESYEIVKNLIKDAMADPKVELVAQ